MKIREREILDVLLRVQEFCTAHPLPVTLPAYTKMLQRLADTITMLENNERDQDGAAAAARETTRIRVDLLQKLREHHMIPLRDTALALRDEVPGLEQKFRVPKTTTNTSILLGAARRMLEQAPAYADLFIEHLRPADFLEQMEGVVTSLERVSVSRAMALRQRGEITRDLETALLQSRKLISFFGSTFRSTFPDEPDTIRGWELVSQFRPQFRGPRTGSSKSGPSTAPATPPSGGAIAPAASHAP